MNWHTFKSQLLKRNETLVHPRSRGKRASSFQTVSSESTEIEFLDFLFGLVRATKPRRILETGTHKGLSTIAMAFALKDNDRLSHEESMIVTIDKENRLLNLAKNQIKKCGLQRFVTIANSDTVTYIERQPKSQRYDFVYFDSSRLTREKEFETLHGRRLLCQASYLVFHDTGNDPVNPTASERTKQNIYLKAIARIRKHCSSCISLELSRGMTICRYTVR